MRAFGNLVARVRLSPEEEANFSWIQLLQEALRQGGYRIDNGNLTVGVHTVEWETLPFSQMFTFVGPVCVASACNTVFSATVKQCLVQMRVISHRGSVLL